MTDSPGNRPDDGSAHPPLAAGTGRTEVVLTPVLATLAGAPAPRRDKDLRDPEIVRDAALVWADGIVVFAGRAADLPPELADGRARSVRGAIVPGFVDSHTHLPFVGWRADEFEARLSGLSYRDLHGRGGGIARSSRLLREASDEDVLAFCEPLCAEMLSLGTTALELKTGYGLSVEGELRQARLARELGRRIAQQTTVTLLACHAVPDAMTRGAWVDAVTAELIPAAAAEGLADAVDVYVEDIAFSLEDLERVTETASAHGLAVRCHADQLGASGAAEAAVRMNARSADHLNHTSDAGVRALAGAAATVATLLPVSTLFMREQPAPAARLLESGAAIGLATDFNPGSSPCLSMPEVIATAASVYRVPPAVALGAVTINPAWVLGMDERLGSLEPGKRADFVVLDTAELSMLAYRPGHDPVEETWIGGERAYPA